MQERSLADRLPVYLVADPDQTSRPFVEDVEAALIGGVTAVQLRVKQRSDRETLELAETIAELCRKHSALFIMNDRLDLAMAGGAEGVHLGVDDLPIHAVREVGSDRLVIGFSPATDEQVTSAAAAGADYLGIGPVFGTTSKADAGDAIGLQTFARRCELAHLPVIGIGGITIENASSVIEAGAAGVAVISAILGASDPERAARTLADSVNEAKYAQSHRTYE